MFDLPQEIRAISNCVYQIKNLVNSKVYVGQTQRTLTSRLRGYFTAGFPNRHLAAAVEKYGVDKFAVSVLAEGFSCAGERMASEVANIAAANSNNADSGYNKTSGGDHPVFSEETRAKLSAKLIGNKRALGRVVSGETRKKLADAHRGRPQAAAQKAGLAQANANRRGKPRSEAERQAIAAGLRGKPKSNEHREKLSAAGRGKKLSPAHCAAIAAGKKGVPLSEKNKEGISRGQKARWIARKAILRYQAEVNRKACEAGAHKRALHEFTTGIFSEDVRKREWVFVPWSESPRDYAPPHALKWERRLHVVACNTTTSNSQFFDGFYDPEKHDVMCAYSQRSDGMWKVSLYSDKPTIDCGEIAKSFGGGGHKGAAGFVCHNLPWVKL